MNNLKDGEAHLEDLKYSISTETHQLLLHPGDVLFNRTNSVDHVGRTGIWRGQIAEASFASYLVRLNIDPQQIDPYYLNRWLNWARTQTRIRAFATPGVHQVNINPSNLRRVTIMMPRKVEEQRKISEILDTLDATIRTTEQLIAKLERMKQGLLHDLLTRGIDENGELRDPVRHPEQFKDSVLGRVPVTWVARELAQIVDPRRPIVYGILMPGQGQSEGVPVVKVKDIVDDCVKGDDLLLTSSEIDREYRRSRLQEGDLLFTIRGTVGRMAFVPKNLDGANITQDTARVAIQDANPVFVREYLRMPIPQRFIETHTVGVAVRGINLGDVRRIPIAIPPAIETDEISLRLGVVDRQIICARAELSKLKLLKDGLADDLLTGRVRVTHLLEDE